MTHPHLKTNVEHIYIMGGGVRSKNPTGCCPKNATTSCTRQQCGDHGNLFTSYSTNPNAKFNIFEDPFSAYQVFHSGIPITLVPLDATNTIPINEEFFYEFQQHQSTYEAQYCFKALKMARDTWFNDQFYTSYFMWVPLLLLEYMNVTVITSNKPYAMHDGSNTLFDYRTTPKFGLKKGGVHSGHVQTGISDSFCRVKGSNKGRCEDGYTKEVSSPEAAHIRVATKAKPNMDKYSPLNREFFKSFLEALNPRENSGRFNIKAQLPFNREGILVSGNGWAHVQSIDIVYDILHMMGRDDIPVGRGNTTALGTPTLGCNYVSIIPQGSGGFIDSDTLYGLARSLPRSPRRYTAENSVKHGAPTNTDHPELQQPLAFEVWQSSKEQLDPSQKITILTNGPLTNLANIVLSDRNASSVIEEAYVVGGHIRDENDSKGNVFTVPSNRYAEFNMLFDPLAAKTVLESSIDITLIPLHVDHTPESSFVHLLMLLLHDLQQKHRLYNHMDMFLGEVLGAVYLVEGLNLKPSLQSNPISIVANSTISTDGQIVVNKESANSVKVLVDFSREEYYNRVANSLSNTEQSAVISSFEEQTRIWSRPPVKLEA
ncbi:hypothetical protein SETIT_3G246900v2 [Setaria italica]|uniref:Inosine/uridine-preferring nucleoside hydrolase domain-containing protein n=1 Tax=Setaria italica TaxID=4555 RepID=K3ZD74_SETIT|nr:hypothetical protein SETIT_3G246900v2 [Setaria italica]